MNPNAILRKISQSLALDVPALQAIFASVDVDLTEKELGNLLKTDYEPRFEVLPEYVLALFLNGYIEHCRGKKAGQEPEVITKTAKISNNDVLKKLRIAHNLHEQHVREALKLVTIELTKSDLSALFRKPGHPQFKACDDELVLDFIEGVGLLKQKAAE